MDNVNSSFDSVTPSLFIPFLSTGVVWYRILASTTISMTSNASSKALVLMNDICSVSTSQLLIMVLHIIPRNLAITLVQNLQAMSFSL